MKQFIDLCNNLGANCSTTTATSPSTSSSSASSTQNLIAVVPPQLQQLQVQLPAPGGGGGAGAGGGGGGAAPVRRHISHTTAVKFLYARKFDIPRAVSLYEQHEQIRLKEYLYNIDPDVEPLRSELQTGKFTILVSGYIFPHLLQECVDNHFRF